MGQCGSSESPAKTELMEAIRRGELKKVKHLLANDAELRSSLNAPDRHGASPLEMAAANGHIHIAMLLLRNGVTPLRVSTRLGSTPLLVAAARGHADVCALLMDSGSDPDERDRSGRTGLHHGSLLGSEAVCYAFLSEDCPVLTPDAAGDTALSVAARLGDSRFQVAKMLLEARGANADVRNGKGDTPLHEAAAAGAVDTVRLLVNHGATVSARNRAGKTPRDVAAEAGMRAVTEVLEAAEGRER